MRYKKKEGKQSKEITFNEFIELATIEQLKLYSSKIQSFRTEQSSINQENYDFDSKNITVSLNQNTLSDNSIKVKLKK